jgi:hypothetical protein
MQRSNLLERMKERPGLGHGSAAGRIVLFGGIFDVHRGDSIPVVIRSRWFGYIFVRGKLWLGSPLVFGDELVARMNKVLDAWQGNSN